LHTADALRTEVLSEFTSSTSTQDVFMTIDVESGPGIRGGRFIYTTRAVYLHLPPSSLFLLSAGLLTPPIQHRRVTFLNSRCAGGTPVNSTQESDDDDAVAALVAATGARASDDAVTDDDAAVFEALRDALLPRWQPRLRGILVRVDDDVDDAPFAATSTPPYVGYARDGATGRFTRVRDYTAPNGGEVAAAFWISLFIGVVLASYFLALLFQYARRILIDTVAHLQVNLRVAHVLRDDGCGSQAVSTRETSRWCDTLAITSTYNFNPFLLPITVLNCVIVRPVRYVFSDSIADFVSQRVQRVPMQFFAVPQSSGGAERALQNVRNLLPSIRRGRKNEKADEQERRSLLHSVRRRNTGTNVATGTPTQADFTSADVSRLGWSDGLRRRIFRSGDDEASKAQASSGVNDRDEPSCEVLKRPYVRLETFVEAYADHCFRMSDGDTFIADHKLVIRRLIEDGYDVRTARVNGVIRARWRRFVSTDSLAADNSATDSLYIDGTVSRGLPAFESNPRLVDALKLRWNREKSTMQESARLAALFRIFARVFLVHTGDASDAVSVYEEDDTLEEPLVPYFEQFCHAVTGMSLTPDERSTLFEPSVFKGLCADEDFTVVCGAQVRIMDVVLRSIGERVFSRRWYFIEILVSFLHISSCMFVPAVVAAFTLHAQFLHAETIAVDDQTLSRADLQSFPWQIHDKSILTFVEVVCIFCIVIMGVSCLMLFVEYTEFGEHASDLDFLDEKSLSESASVDSLDAADGKHVSPSSVHIDVAASRPAPPTKTRCCAWWRRAPVTTIAAMFVRYTNAFVFAVGLFALLAYIALVAVWFVLAAFLDPKRFLPFGVAVITIVTIVTVTYSQMRQSAERLRKRLQRSFQAQLRSSMMRVQRRVRRRKLNQLMTLSEAQAEKRTRQQAAAEAGALFSFCEAAAAITVQNTEHGDDNAIDNSFLDGDAELSAAEIAEIFSILRTHEPPGKAAHAASNVVSSSDSKIANSHVLPGDDDDGNAVEAKADDDAAGDGVQSLSRTQFFYLFDLFDINLSRHDKLQIFAYCDLDYTGRVTQLEFAEAWQWIEARLIEQMLKEFGLGEHSIIITVVVIALVVIALFAFIFVALKAFAVADSFESVIQSIMVAGAGAGVHLKRNKSKGEEVEDDKGSSGIVNNFLTRVFGSGDLNMA
jgi:hypothetical protein